MEIVECVSNGTRRNLRSSAKSQKIPLKINDVSPQKLVSSDLLNIQDQLLQHKKLHSLSKRMPQRYNIHSDKEQPVEINKLFPIFLSTVRRANDEEILSNNLVDDIANIKKDNSTLEVKKRKRRRKMTEQSKVTNEVHSLRKIEQILPGNHVLETNTSDLVTIESDACLNNNIKDNQMNKNTLEGTSGISSLCTANEICKIFPIFVPSNSSPIKDQIQRHDIDVQSNFVSEDKRVDMLCSEKKIQLSCTKELYSLNATAIHNIQKIERADSVNHCFPSRWKKRGRKCKKKHKEVINNNGVSEDNLRNEKQSTNEIVLLCETFNGSKNIRDNEYITECMINNSVHVNDVKCSITMFPKNMKNSIDSNESLKFFPLFSRTSPKKDLSQENNSIKVDSEPSSTARKNILRGSEHEQDNLDIKLLDIDQILSKENISVEIDENLPKVNACVKKLDEIPIEVAKEETAKKRRKCKIKMSANTKLTKASAVTSKKVRNKRLKNTIKYTSAKHTSRKNTLSTKIIPRRRQHINKNKSVDDLAFEEVIIESISEKNTKEIKNSAENRNIFEDNILEALPLTKKRRGRKYRKKNKQLKNSSKIFEDVITNEKPSTNEVQICNEIINKYSFRMGDDIKHDAQCTNNYKHNDDIEDATNSIKLNSRGSSKAQKLFPVFSNFSPEKKRNMSNEAKEEKSSSSFSGDCIVGKEQTENMQNNLDVMLPDKNDEKYFEEDMSPDNINVNFMKGNILGKIEEKFSRGNMSEEDPSEVNETIKQKLQMKLPKNMVSAKTLDVIPKKQKDKKHEKMATKGVCRRKQIINKNKQDDSVVEGKVAKDVSKNINEIQHCTKNTKAYETKDKIAETFLPARKKRSRKCRSKNKIDNNEIFYDGNEASSRNENEFYSETITNASSFKVKNNFNYQADYIHDNSIQSTKNRIRLSKNDVNSHSVSATKSSILFPLFSKSCPGKEVNQGSNLPQGEPRFDNNVENIVDESQTEDKQKKLEVKQSDILEGTFPEESQSLDKIDKNLKGNMLLQKVNKGLVQETLPHKNIQRKKAQREIASAEIFSIGDEEMQNKKLRKIIACKDPGGISEKNILETKRTVKKRQLPVTDNTSEDSASEEITFKIISQNSINETEQSSKSDNIFQKDNAVNVFATVKRKRGRKCRMKKQVKSNDETFYSNLNNEKKIVNSNEFPSGIIDASKLKVRYEIDSDKECTNDNFVNFSIINDPVQILSKNINSNNADSNKPLKLYPLFSKTSPNENLRQGNNVLKEEPISSCDVRENMLEEFKPRSKQSNFDVKFSDQIAEKSPEICFKQKQKMKISRNTTSAKVLDIAPKDVRNKRIRKTTECKGGANISEKNILTSKRTTRKRQLVIIDDSGDEEIIVKSISQNSTNETKHSIENYVFKENTIGVYGNKASTDEVQEIVIKNISKNEGQQSVKSDNIFKEDGIEEASNDKCIVTKKMLPAEENFTHFPSFTHCNLPRKDLNCDIFCSTSSEILYEDVRKPNWNHIIGLTDIKSIHEIIRKENVNKCLTSVINERLNDNICKKEYENSQYEMLWTDYLNDFKEDSNKSIVNEIKTWLLQWKSKFKKPCLDESSVDSFSSDSCDSTDDVSKSIIIAGMPGTGKTSLVLSLANELGFKVLEVNSSSCRNGRNVSNELKEALESYHVENIKIEDTDSKTALTCSSSSPVSHNTQNSTCKNKVNTSKDIFKDEKCSGGKSLSSRNLIKSKKAYLLDKGQKTTSPEKEPEKSIKNFFKTINKEEKHNSNSLEVMQQNIELSKTQIEDENDIYKSYVKKKKGVKEFFQIKNSDLNDSKEKKELSSCKISTLTIILFDDIDVIFEEDEGLWNTIKGFLKISRKPVIFTVSRNLAYVKANLCEDIRVLTLKPSLHNIAVEKVKYQCVKHDKGNTSIDLQLLISHNANDLRRSLLDTQFWTQTKETSCTSEGRNFCNMNATEVPLYKTIHANSFFLGSLSFLTRDLKQLLLSYTTSHSMNIISEYHKMGYDVLHNNIFSIMNVLDNIKTDVLWQNMRNHSDRGTTNSTSESNMWDEACKLFEFKKAALLKGSPSNDLFLFSSILEDFSFADSLKGKFCSNFHWVSVPERVKKWTDGLPMCSDNNFHRYDDILADIIALINIYKIREVCSKYPDAYSLQTDRSVQLFLEHPLLNCDYVLNNKTEQQIQCISTALPSSHLLSKTNLNMDYLSILKIMCQSEHSKQMNSCKRSRRFLHYFDSISLALDKFDTKLILES